jgi:hypothetical protein
MVVERVGADGEVVRFLDHEQSAFTCFRGQTGCAQQYVPGVNLRGDTARRGKSGLRAGTGRDQSTQTTSPMSVFTRKVKRLAVEEFVV